MAEVATPEIKVESAEDLTQLSARKSPLDQPNGIEGKPKSTERRHLSRVFGVKKYANARKSDRLRTEASQQS